MVMNFKVYTVAWYVDPIKAPIDATLQPFIGLSSDELASTPAFYQAMVSPEARYDRSLLIKLAMSLNVADVMKALVEEFGLLPENSVSKSYSSIYISSSYSFFLL